MYHLIIEQVSLVLSSSSNRIKPSEYQVDCQTDRLVYLQL
jgi:hypothetical protein